MPAKRLEIFLRGLPEALVQEYRKIAAVQRVYDAVAPKNLTEFSHVAACHAGRVILLTDRGVFASKIKQLLPRLLLEFRQQGLDINAIDVRVQVRSSRLGRSIIVDRNSREISARGLACLADLEARLRDPQLRKVVRRLRRSHEKRSTTNAPASKRTKSVARQGKALQER